MQFALFHYITAIRFASARSWNKVSGVTWKPCLCYANLYRKRIRSLSSHNLTRNLCGFTQGEIPSKLGLIYDSSTDSEGSSDQPARQPVEKNNILRGEHWLQDLTLISHCGRCYKNEIRSNIMHTLCGSITECWKTSACSNDASISLSKGNRQASTKPCHWSQLLPWGWGYQTHLPLFLIQYTNWILHFLCINTIFLGSVPASFQWCIHDDFRVTQHHRNWGGRVGRHEITPMK